MFVLLAGVCKNLNAQVLPGNAPAYQFTGSTVGYEKSNNQIYVKNIMRAFCPFGFVVGGGSPDTSVWLWWSKNMVLYFNNADTSVIKENPYLPHPYSPNYMLVRNRNCTLCPPYPTHSTPVLLQNTNEFSTSVLRFAPMNQAVMEVPHSVQSLTIFHGTFDIFYDRYAYELKNVTPGGTPFISNNIFPWVNSFQPPTRYFSRIYRFHDYDEISSPEPLNKNVIIGFKGKPTTYNPGYFDKEGDSVNVVPLLLTVTDTNLGNIPYAATLVQGQVTPAIAAKLKHHIRNHTEPIQYEPGFSPSNPFGPGSSFSLNQQTGEFTFTAPDTGIYLLAFRVEEYRNSQLLGDIMTYRLALVKDSTVATLPQISNAFSVTGATYNAAAQTMTICAGQTMSYKVSAASPLANAAIVATSNAAQSAPGSVVSYTSQGSDSVTYNFTWTPGKDDVGQHLVYVDAVDTFCGPGHYPAHQSKGVMIYVHGGNIIASDTTLCLGDTVTLQSFATGVNQWQALPGGDPAMPCFVCNTVKVSPAVTTTYVLYNKYEQCTATDTITIQVIPPFSIIASNDTSFAGPVPSVYSMNVSVIPPGYYDYLWTPFNKVTNPQAPNTQLLNPENHNTYVITVKDSFNCFARVDTVHVHANTAGVKDVSASERIELYPNPTSGSFTVKTSAAGTLTITTAEGKRIASYKIKQGATELSLPVGTAQGIYQLIFEADGDGQRQVMKLMYRE